jgi:hypothetical protein
MVYFIYLTGKGDWMQGTLNDQLACLRVEIRDVLHIRF